MLSYCTSKVTVQAEEGKINAFWSIVTPDLEQPTLASQMYSH